MLRFEKVDKVYYDRAIESLGEEKYLTDTRKECYWDIELPQRATEGSAGYDFFAPYDLHCKANTWYIIPLGIKYVTDLKDVVLLMAPRSGLGFKYNFQLSNTIGIIDNDYQYANNDGHIMVKFKVNQDLDIKKGQSIIQGVFTTFLKVDYDETAESRVGGFGSTSVIL